MNQQHYYNPLLTTPVSDLGLNDYALFERDTLGDLPIPQEDFSKMSVLDRLRTVFEYNSARMLATTSGGIQSGSLLLHLALLRDREDQFAAKITALPIIFLDTGDLFDETIEYVGQLKKIFNLNIRRYSHGLSESEFQNNLSLLEETGFSKADAYDQLTKVKPMQAIIAKYQANLWLAGNRRDQSNSRRYLDYFKTENGVLKFFPLADISASETIAILDQYQIPKHPLAEQFRSVGNRRDTIVSHEGLEKSGRHGGSKEECGLHLFWSKKGKIILERDGGDRIVG